MIAHLTFWAVTSAALVDAINPCAFAVLILLMTTILFKHTKKKAMFSGFLFTGAVYLSYFLMGIGIFTAIQTSHLSRIFYIFVTCLAYIVGLFNLKDFFWYGKLFVMEVPFSWRPRLKALISGVTSPIGAFFVGFLVSFFLLPCTSGPYIVILGLLARKTTRITGIIYLLYYNLIFILPMLLITLVISFGLSSAAKLERFRRKRIRYLHLVAGIVMLCLAVIMTYALLNQML